MKMVKGGTDEMLAIRLSPNQKVFSQISLNVYINLLLFIYLFIILFLLP